MMCSDWCILHEQENKRIPQKAVHLGRLLVGIEGRRQRTWRFSDSALKALKHFSMSSIPYMRTIPWVDKCHPAMESSKHNAKASSQ
jgi:hypothetical protein